MTLPRDHYNEKRADSNDYLRHWKGTGDTGDTEGRGRRNENYNKLANDFYDNATDFYLEGWGQSFHFCRYPHGPEPMPRAMARHEHYLAHRLELKSGMTVMDAGCGVGGPAKEIAKFIDCKVVGLNNNDYQVQKGREIARKEGVDSEVVDFVVGDFMRIPFPDNTFDAVYAIEATVHASSLQAVYSEIYRVLKPGGRFGVYEWVMKSASFDPSVEQHIALRTGIERGNGIANIRTSDEAISAIKDSGFDLEVAEDIAEHEDPLPWWYVCDGSTEYARTWADWGRVARMTRFGRIALHFAIKCLEITGVARKGTAIMAKEMIGGGDCIASAARKGLFTPMYLLIGQKPGKQTE
ncbi:putative tocopherol O-methyltransferase [Periconia macrospinosa]|uniref:Sterol 24-C-methyltransferase n=1 Tax=Periconia macrospinosa TaxID=97972 RepID=A0A2V1DXC9_9PLEO|nr:putative tocopherol O-methyltransferase [Periconia macrospinosa]